MPSKTVDIEAALESALAAGPLTLDQIRAVGSGYEPDPRWTGVALAHLTKDGRVRYPICDNGHSHEAGCTVELIGA
ncbi:MAG TPA: hypothetical protein VI172_14775 [Candidatus Dormibacteraeota bacterium]|jgi:hypothetical protein